MNFSELKGRAVVDTQDAKKVGEVDDLLIEPATHQTVGLVLKSGLFSHAQIVPIAHIQRIGPDAVMISQVGSASETEPPQHTTSTVSAILNNKVVTDAGSLVGSISDVLLDPNTLEITGYAFKPDGLFAKTREFPVSPAVRYGPQLVTVPEQLINRPGQDT